MLDLTEFDERPFSLIDNLRGFGVLAGVFEQAVVGFRQVWDVVVGAVVGISEVTPCPPHARRQLLG